MIMINLRLYLVYSVQTRNFKHSRLSSFNHWKPMMLGVIKSGCNKMCLPYLHWLVIDKIWLDFSVVTRLLLQRIMISHVI